VSIDELMTKAFAVPRDRRSEEYKKGVRSALELRFNGEKQTCPYEAGTAQADAFFSGINEGFDIWRRETIGVEAL
jgi:hypothetical protein